MNLLRNIFSILKKVVNNFYTQCAVGSFGSDHRTMFNEPVRDFRVLGYLGELFLDYNHWQCCNQQPMYFYNSLRCTPISASPVSAPFPQPPPAHTHAHTHTRTHTQHYTFNALPNTYNYILQMITHPINSLMMQRIYILLYR